MAELSQIREFRDSRKGVSAGGPYAESQPQDLVGLAVSGGGIRSATFNLGLFQALAESGVLPLLDYISAVSGGGYIVGWFCKCVSKLSFSNTVERLRLPSGKSCPQQIHWLRQNSSYLTPSLGLLGHDMSLFLATYAQNLFINLILLLLLCSFVVLCPRLVLAALKSLSELAYGPFLTSCLGCSLALCSAMLVLYRLVLANEKVEEKDLQHRTRICVISTSLALIFYYLKSLGVSAFFWGASVLALYTGHSFWVMSGIVILLMTIFVGIDLSGMFPYWPVSMGLAMLLASLIMQLWSKQNTSTLNRRRTVAIFSISGAFFIVVSLYSNVRERPEMEFPRHNTYFELMVWANRAGSLETHLVSVAGAAILGLLIWFYLKPLSHSQPGHDRFWSGRLHLPAPFSTLFVVVIVLLYLTAYRAASTMHGLQWLLSYYGVPIAFTHIFALCVPILILVGAVTFNVIVGICNDFVEPYKRERITSVSAMLYLYSAVFLCSTMISLYGPLLMASGHPGTHIVVLVVSGTASLFSSSENALGTARSSMNAVGLMGRALPYVAFTSVLMWVSWGVSVFYFGISPDLNADAYMIKLYDTYNITLIPATLGVLLLLMGVASGLGVNMASLHLFYQGRLAWAYLSEYLPGSPADGIEGERGSMWDDSRDNRRLTKLHALLTDNKTFQGPYPILNATLNLVGGDELAWQERRAANFIFSPLYCGFDVVKTKQVGRPSNNRFLHQFGYASTAAFDGGSGLRLAQAMAISGSAVGTNMGQQTSARARFLHTLINARLGWWLQNPRWPGSWTEKKNIRRGNITLLLGEILGRTNDKWPYVYLSDGGHFENLGIYELVRRKCSLIIASDASEDENRACLALGNAIEKCRTDFDVEIEIDISRLYGKHSTVSWAVGSIQYPGNPGKQGVLIYLKPTITPDTPVDVVSYAKRHPQFPNEPTFNQWFTESQFESYRVLGRRGGLSLCKALKESSEKHTGNPYGDLLFHARNLLEDYATPPQRSQSAETTTPEYGGTL